MYVSSAVAIGRGLEMVHEEGIGEIAGPPARFERVELGSADVKVARDARMIVEISILINVVGCSCRR